MVLIVDTHDAPVAGTGLGLVFTLYAASGAVSTMIETRRIHIPPLAELVEFDRAARDVEPILRPLIRWVELQQRRLPGAMRWYGEGEADCAVAGLPPAGVTERLGVYT